MACGSCCKRFRAAACGLVALTSCGAFATPAVPTAARYAFHVRVNSHVDARVFAEHPPSDVDTLLIRRLSVSMEAELGPFAARLMPDLSASKTSFPEAYVAWKPSPVFNLLAGKTKSPFDLERLVSQTDLLFIERAWPTSLAPNRDVGLQVSGEAAHAFSYQVGWLDGARDNDSVTHVDLPLNDVVGRVMVHPFKDDAASALHGLAVGIAASRGERQGVRPNSVRTHAQQRFFSWRSGVELGGTHARIEPQASFSRGPFGLLGSWVESRRSLKARPDAPVQQVALRAWMLAAHWVITGEEATLRGLTPANPFRWDGGGRGAFEVVARVGGFRAGRGAFPLFADPAVNPSRARSATLGVNWHPHRRAKVSLDLEHTSFAGGERGAVSRADERALLARLQLRY